MTDRVRPSATLAAVVRDPLAWALFALVALTLGMNRLKPLFAAAFPALERPVYEQDSFLSLVIAHIGIVAVSSGVSIVVGIAVGIFVTRSFGAEFRSPFESIVALGQSFPPVAVLAVAVPLIGFGDAPALVALAVYGLLPIVQHTIAGLESVPRAARDAARGLGMSAAQMLVRVELPLAFPVIVAGVRTSVIINIGTAALASTVGAKTLGSPIIVGLSGFNTAYVLQGAVLVGLLAIVTDLSFERLGRYGDRWRLAAA